MSGRAENAVRMMTRMDAVQSPIIPVIGAMGRGGRGGAIEIWVEEGGVGFIPGTKVSNSVTLN